MGKDSIISKFFGLIRASDEITAPSALKLHIGEDKKLRTMLGGMISIFIKVYVSYAAAKWAIQMFYLEDP